MSKISQHWQPESILESAHVLNPQDGWQGGEGNSQPAPRAKVKAKTQEAEAPSKKRGWLPPEVQ